MAGGFLPTGGGGEDRPCCPLLISSSGHVVGRQPKPRADAGRARIILALLGIVGLCVLLLGGLSTRSSEGDHVVIAVVPAERLPPPRESLSVPLNSTRR